MMCARKTFERSLSSFSEKDLGKDWGYLHSSCMSMFTIYKLINSEKRLV